MKVILQFDVNADSIECPELIVKELERYQTEFFEWLCDKKNDHAYWMYRDGEKFGLSYRSDAFVEWLNTVVLVGKNEKASILEEEINDYSKDLPKLFF